MQPDATVSPGSGPAGTTVEISVSVYSPNIEIFVYEGGDDSGTLLGTGMTGGDGTGSFPITIPVDAPVGSYLMYICGLCDAQFPEWATRGFTVTSSPGTTTTTAAPTTTAAATTTVAATTSVGAETSEPATTVAAAPSTTMDVPPVVDDGLPTLAIVLMIVIGILGVVFVGLLVSARKPRSPLPPSAPPPPPAP